jgi:hypothetical protein
MRFEEWLTKLPYSYKSKLARFVGVSPATVTRWGLLEDNPKKLGVSSLRAVYIESFSRIHTPENIMHLEITLGRKKAAEFRRAAAMEALHNVN